MTLSYFGARRRFRLIASALVLLIFIQAIAARAEERAPRGVQQLVVAVADSWDESRAMLRCYERPANADAWRPVVFDASVPVLLGRNGLGWGRGVLPKPKGWHGPIKGEGDRRAPAGYFRMGRVFGYPERSPNTNGYPYRKVTRWDAWVDDVNHPDYNRHVVVDPNNVPKWFHSQRMRHGDHAYTYLIEIRHNADPPQPGMGSAIFFHIRRGPNRPTSGCTTMERAHLERMIGWLEVAKRPHYVLLPKREYAALAKAWELPAW